MIFTKRVIRLVVVVLIAAFIFPLSASADLVHRVTTAESLYSISHMYRVDVNKIIQKNHLGDSTIIFPRQVLIIPGVSKNDIYRVTSGDTLYQISKKLDVPFTLLVEKNSLTNLNNIYPGQVLFIPEKPVPPPANQNNPVNQDSVYTVIAGDTLYIISTKLGVSMEALVQENNLSDKDYLYVGQVLQIPSKDTVSTPKPVPTPQPKPTPKPYLIPQYLKDYPQNFFIRGKANSKKIALTFDDGPDNIYTPQILDVLKKENVRATFFLIGKNINNAQDVVRRIAKEGHVIGNHSWGHANLPKLDQTSVYTEIKQVENLVKEITGLQTALVRPPYGEVSDQLLAQLTGLGYKAVNWSADSLDWKSKDVDEVLIHVLPDISNGSIVLFHSAGGRDQSLANTVAALPELIYTLKVLGYEFVTVDELLNTNAYN